MAIDVNLSIKVPTAQEVTDFVTYHGWTAKVVDPEDETKEIDNPVTKAAFAKSKIIDFVRDSIKAYRANAAQDEARTTATEAVDALTIE